MESIAIEKLKDEKIIGVIPINPKGLKMKFANKSLSPGFFSILLMFVISLPLTIILLAMLSFILADLMNHMHPVSLFFIIILFFAILALPTFIIYKIYVNKIKKYPEAIFVITENDLSFFLIVDKHIAFHHKFGIPYHKLSEAFFGEIDKKTNALGANFEIRQNNKELVKGKLKLDNNKFIENNIESKYLLPIKELQNIYMQ